VTHLACYSYAVGHASEGICIRLEIDRYRILLDCGLRTFEELDAAAAAPADVVLCSHAHADHARGLPWLHHTFPKLPIYASEVTAQLLTMVGSTAAPIDSFCQALPWRSPIELLQGLTVELIPAGHLPGAAAMLFSYARENERPVQVFYTGDFFLSNSRLAEGLRLAEVRGLSPDVLIVEGSYGVMRQPHRRQQENHLMERIDRALSNGQSILLPVSRLGMGQELLALLRSHHLFTGRDLDLWVTAGVAQGCDLYTELITSFPQSVQNFARHQALFWDEKVRPRMRRWEQSDPNLDINSDPTPCIVVADLRSSLTQFCQSGDWLVLFLESSQHDDEWLNEQIHGQTESNAIVTAESYWLSEHSDGNATLQLIHNLRPQHLVLVHGAIKTLAEFAQLEELSNRYKVHIPQADSLIEFAIDEAPPPTLPPETRYEGEVVETAASIALTLPLEMMQDSRWRAFADTGIVEAHWHGEELVLRGLSAADVLSRIDRERNSVSNCGHCQFYRSSRCEQAESPLFNLQVTIASACPEFKPLVQPSQNEPVRSDPD
jgi:Cft2 family RNA processing exonuclease